MFVECGISSDLGRIMGLTRRGFCRIPRTWIGELNLGHLLLDYVPHTKRLARLCLSTHKRSLLSEREVPEVLVDDMMKARE
jgi:hypothetical protein